MGILNKNQVSTLLSLGADAMDNMFDISIDLPAGLTTFSAEGFTNEAFKNTMTIRADGFSPPKASAVPYTVKYKTVAIERPSTKIEFKREFKISFRLDANYQAYRLLSTWRSLVMQPSSGYATNALYGDGADETSSNLNKVFGKVNVSALSRPIYMSDGTKFEQGGQTGGKFTDDSLKTTTLNDSELTTWSFYQVWISDLDEPTFKTEGGDAIKISATFKFGEYVDPVYRRLGNV